MSTCIVALGDSITDGFAYPMLAAQALARAGKPVPRFVNGGVASDTAADVLARLGRDAISFRPDMVTLSVGINDLIRNVPLAVYDEQIDQILATLREARIEVILLTTSLLTPRHEDAYDRQPEFNMALRRHAREYGHRVADVDFLMERAAGQGAELLEEDGVHPNFAGHRIMAQALLNALDHTDVQVPERLLIEPSPGLIPRWLVKPIVDGHPDSPYVTELNVKSLRPDYRWQAVTLPESTPQEGWWYEQVRQEGFALSLTRQIAPAPRFLAAASLELATARTVWLNLGGYVRAIWIDDACAYQHDGVWRGFHAGRERLPIPLESGSHSILLEVGPQFFFSVTDRRLW